MFGRILIPFFFIFLSLTSFATDKHFLDSVENVLNSTKYNEKKVNCLYTLSFEYGFIEPRKAIDFGKKCLNLSRQIGDITGEYNAYNALGNAYETLSNYDSARYYHFKTFEIAKKRSSKRGMAITLMNIALTYKEQGDYKKALKFHLEAYKLIENSKEINPRMFFYIGEMYMRLGDFSSAELFTLTGIEKSRNKSFNYILPNLFINLSKCYLHRGKADSAVALLNKTQNELIKYTDKLSICNCLNTLGEAYCLKKDYEKALGYFSEELSLENELSNNNGICLSYLNIANCYARLDKKEKAGNFLQESEKRLLSINKNKDILRNTYFKISETYELINETEKALYYFKKFYGLSDSLLNKEKLQQLNELQTKYETEKKERQIQLQKTEITHQGLLLEKQRLQLIAVLSVLGFSLITVFYSYNRHKLRQKLKLETAIKEKENQERIRIAKDMHDELGSGLSKISILSELTRVSLKDTDAKQNIEIIAKTSREIAQNMRTLIWAINPETKTLDSLVTMLREYSNDIFDEIPFEVIRNFPEEVEELNINKDAQRNLFLTYKESLNNILKHSQADRIELSVKAENNSLSISVNDNGKGFDMETVRKTGNGLLNMNERMIKIGGRFSISSANGRGTQIQINVPFENLQSNV